MSILRYHDTFTKGAFASAAFVARLRCRLPGDLQDDGRDVPRLGIEKWVLSQPSGLPLDIPDASQCE